MRSRRRQMTTLHIIVEIAEQIPTGRTEWRVDCAECGWYDMFDDRRRAEDAATRHVGDSHNGRAQSSTVLCRRCG